MFIKSVFVLSAAVISVSARPFNVRRDVDPNLVPQFGVQAGVNPTGTGDCDGVPNAQGVAIKIPCSCPPDRALFIADLNANVAAGHAVNNTGVQLSFPTDNSKASQLARLNAATITLQNLHGPGVGCPQAATTFGAQAQAIQNGTPAPAPAAPAPAPAKSVAPAPAAPAPAPAKSVAPAPAAPAPAPASGGVDPNLVPQFGVQPGVNPTGTGDCDGIPNAQGVAIKIPCSCPPDRATFIQDLSANVAAGHAVNNTGVKLSFPTDNSQASQLARLNAATITLQNLHGPGVGCPQASTTFGAQAQAIQAGTAAPAPVLVAVPAPAKPAAPAPAAASGGVDPNLVPQFGVQPGVNPTGTGDCDGIPNAQGVAIKIPCICPPDRATFIQDLSANVAAGHAVNNTGVKLSFPTDNSQASQLARLNAATITLQNLRGPGVGCPQASTTFGAQAQAIQAGTAPPTPAAPAASAPAKPAAPAPAPAQSSPAPASGGVDPNLVPQFGVQPGVNPTGTGDCDGIPNAQGVAIKIPCSCPPDRTSFIASLNANVAVGHAVNNPTVKLSFPTDNSKASQLARLNAATITLQNLHGPGQGCPQAATTFGAQAQAIQNS